MIKWNKERINECEYHIGYINNKRLITLTYVELYKKWCLTTFHSLNNIWLNDKEDEKKKVMNKVRKIVKTQLKNAYKSL